jgi:acyl carrier protein
MGTTFERVQKVVVNRLKVSADEVKEAVTFEDLGADELDKIDVVIGIEDEFEINISDDDWDGVKTIGEAVTLVNKLEGR